ncbi:MAG: hypothetical protein LBR06_06185 [Bacteroidales bacterium]|jgi:hypothetical protein|nr:hypothetical protein [Bacteroidales bacterium]
MAPSAWTYRLQALIRALRMKKNNRQMGVFIVCVCMSTLFWFLNALKKEYTVELEFPVQYRDMPPNKVPLSVPPRQFSFQVRAGGFALLRYKWSSSFSPVVFNVNELTERRMELSDKMEFRFPTRTYIRKLSEQLSNELQISEITPDTLEFSFDRLVSRRLRVLPVVTCEMSRQFFQDEPVYADPDSVLVSGPASLVDTLRCAPTVPQHFKNVDRTLRRTVAIGKYEGLTFSPDKVTIVAPVAEYTQKQFDVPIKVDKLPAGMKITLFPDHISVSFMISLNRFASVKPDDFTATVPYSDIQKTKDALDVNLTVQPADAISVSFTPKQVEYLIER